MNIKLIKHSSTKNLPWEIFQLEMESILQS